MDVRFVVRSSAFLLPVVVLFSIAWHFHIFEGDYAVHLAYRGDGDYPPALAWMLNTLEFIIPRELGLFLIAVLTVVYLPFILVFEITRKEEASWIYLYGSGIPLVLYFVWFVPQSIIHILILATVRWWWFAFIFLAVGWLIHSAWLPALLLALAYRWYNAR